MKAKEKEREKESSSSSSSGSEFSSSSSSSSSHGRFKRFKNKEEKKVKEKRVKEKNQKLKEIEKESKLEQPEIEVIPLNSYLVIKGLTRNIEESHIREITSLYGPIKFLSYLKDSNGKFRHSSKSQAFIEFEKNEQTELAQRCLNEGQIDGWIISTEILNITEKELEVKLKSIKKDIEEYKYSHASFNRNFPNRNAKRGRNFSPRDRARDRDNRDFNERKPKFERSTFEDKRRNRNQRRSRSRSRSRS